jgi:hypothetical protein
MKRNSLGKFAAAAASLAMLLPPTAMATTPAAPTNDVALRAGGLLVGQVVDAQGVAKAGTAVSIRQGENEVARTTTDANGMFAAKGLRGGQYQLQTEEGTSDCRLWAADTAPPAARPGALIVTGNDVVRGQSGGGVVGWVRAHPYITAGVVAAAIATPLAFIDDDDDDNGS